MASLQRLTRQNTKQAMPTKRSTKHLEDTFKIIKNRRVHIYSFKPLRTTMTSIINSHELPATMDPINCELGKWEIIKKIMKYQCYTSKF